MTDPLVSASSENDRKRRQKMLDQTDPLFAREWVSKMERRLWSLQKYVVTHAPAIVTCEQEAQFLNVLGEFYRFAKEGLPTGDPPEDGWDVCSLGHNFTICQLSALTLFANQVTSMTQGEHIDVATLRELCRGLWNQWQQAHLRFFDERGVVPTI
jgi:hypothetical protein